MSDTKSGSEQTQEKPLSDQELDELSGGLNPQPLPPGDKLNHT